MRENKDIVIAALKEQIETKSSMLQAISKIVAYREKEVEDLNCKIAHLTGALKEADDLRKELKSLQEKFNALKYYGRDTEVDALKREVNHLRDYIEACYSRMGFKDILELERKYYFDNTSKRYTIN
jgi:cell shape-determining protein MreC